MDMLAYTPVDFNQLKTLEKTFIISPEKNQAYPLLKYRYCCPFPSDYVPTLDNDTFAIINRQPSNMQGEHWIMIANSREILYFADSLGRKRYSFLKQQYQQIMPEPLQSHPSVCGFYTI